MVEILKVEEVGQSVVFTVRDGTAPTDAELAQSLGNDPSVTEYSYSLSHKTSYSPQAMAELRAKAEATLIETLRAGSERRVAEPRGQRKILESKPRTVSMQRPTKVTPPGRP